VSDIFKATVAISISVLCGGASLPALAQGAAATWSAPRDAANAQGAAPGASVPIAEATEKAAAAPVQSTPAAASVNNSPLTPQAPLPQGAAKTAAPAKPSAVSAAPSFPIGGKVSRAIQKYSGINWLTEVIASEAAKIAVKRRLGGNVKAKIQTFSLTDLLAGKVKSINITVNGAEFNNVPLGDVQVKSSQPVWFSLSSKKYGRKGLMSPVLMSVKANLTQKEICSALESSKVAESLSGLRLDLPGLGAQQLKVVRPRVQLADDLIKIDALLMTEGAQEESAVPITISGRPELEGSKIVLKDMKVTSPEIEEPEKFAAFAEDLLNPIVDLGRLDRRDHAIRLTDLIIKHNSIHGDGTLLIAPKQDLQLAEKKSALN
jgi:hypothetical protein